MPSPQPACRSTSSSSTEPSPVHTPSQPTTSARANAQASEFSTGNESSDTITLDDSDMPEATNNDIDTYICYQVDDIQVLVKDVNRLSSKQWLSDSCIMAFMKCFTSKQRGLFLDGKQATDLALNGKLNLTKKVRNMNLSLSIFNQELQLFRVKIKNIFQI